ncbi:MAG TPA: cysteine dioxygenase family protein [Planctomycetota bacterium]|nr:cysteine dioxygenase family protein [Planctomycetota bacterium]
MQPTPRTLLCQALTREFARDPKGPGAVDLLSSYARTHQDWREWALFDSECYTRNLIHHEEHYELLLLCWGAGQKSPIHNHQGQRCWMAVLEGQIAETLFHFPEASASSASAVIRAKGPARLYAQSQVAFITDEIALHEIAAAGEAPAVSLHLYSRPFSTCQVYERETGRIAVRQLSYFSVQGRRELSTRPS